ncbi:MAG: hypothetical protein LBU90_05810 [Bacteroidales bacterium]|jgi:hypothetical protein|nr:hypothetical protein [Bacteroidales bacterium]
MNSILNNPYRTLGILAGATARELSKQTNRLRKFIEAEQTPPADDFSFPALGKLTRTTESIESAASKLNLDNDKMHAALFWFWNGKPLTDEVAFEAIREGNTDAAYQLWDRLVSEVDENGNRVLRKVTGKNASAFHNLFVLAASTNKGSFETAVVANIKFIESTYFDKFVEATVDSTFRVNKKEIELNFLQEVAQAIDSKKLAKLVRYLNGYQFEAKTEFLKSLTQKHTTAIAAQIETCKKKRSANKASAAAAGEELHTNTKNDLAQLKTLAGATDYAYTTSADKVANEMLQCSIDFFNHSQDTDATTDYHHRAMQLAKQAESIAEGSVVKGRIQENLKTLEEMKDKELQEALAVLLFIKTAYQENERKIDAMVAQASRNMPFGQSINWSAVEEMKRNSLKWDEIVNLVKQSIPPRNIEKIKNAGNQSKISEYKQLVNFLFSKLSNSQERSVKYLDYSNKESWFPKNAWWVLGISGGVIGAAAGSFLVGVGIGAGIGWIIKKANKLT